MKEKISQYKIGTGIYEWRELSGLVQSKFRFMGLSEGIMPDHEKEYFDTLRALLLLCMSEGYSPKFINNHVGDLQRCVHVGDIATPNTHRTVYGLRGSYFWRLVLSDSGDPVLARVAKSKFKDVELSSLEKEFSDLNERLGDDFLEFCSRVLAMKKFELSAGECRGGNQ
jgi:hypothetical protein